MDGDVREYIHIYPSRDGMIAALGGKTRKDFEDGLKFNNAGSMEISRARVEIWEMSQQ